jgi:hypothetical protein
MIVITAVAGALSGFKLLLTFFGPGGTIEVSTDKSALMLVAVFIYAGARLFVDLYLGAIKIRRQWVKQTT